MYTIRIDFIFSYWIFIWYILYELKLTVYNPKLVLWFGLFENLLHLLLMIYYKNSLISIFLFILVDIFIKIIPLWKWLLED